LKACEGVDAELHTYLTSPLQRGIGKWTPVKVSNM